MIIFKNIEQFDQNTGKSIGSRRIPDCRICDWTGEKISIHDNPNSYSIDFNSNDPCFGDGLGEGWVFKLPEPFSYAHHDLFGQCEYIFSVKNGYVEPIMDILKAFNEEEGFDNLYGIDTLLRWSRARMLKRVIEEEKYKIEDFLEDLRDYGE